MQREQTWTLADMPKPSQQVSNSIKPILDGDTDFCPHWATNLSQMCLHLPTRMCWILQLMWPWFLFPSLFQVIHNSLGRVFVVNNLLSSHCGTLCSLGRKTESTQPLKPPCVLFCCKFKVLLSAWFCFELKMKASIEFHSSPVKQAISLSLFMLPLPAASPWSLSASVNVNQSWMSWYLREGKERKVFMLLFYKCYIAV